ncbi:hypothetical protein EDB84DRAFT_1566396 [Lactarius hengduanensis]|nr:hypothetical protein EDB84DRAFT_1566396 [Lactarius hengduanensis]
MPATHVLLPPRGQNDPSPSFRIVDTPFASKRGRRKEGRPTPLSPASRAERGARGYGAHSARLPLSLPPPFSPVHAATFTRKGGAARTCRCPFPCPPHPIHAESGARGHAAPGPSPSHLDAPPVRAEGGTRGRPPPLPSPFARKGCTRARPPRPFPPWPRHPVQRGKGAREGTRFPAHPSPFARKGGGRGHAAPPSSLPPALPFSFGPRHPVRKGTPPPAPHPSPSARTGGVHEGMPPPALPFSLGPRHPVHAGWRHTRAATQRHPSPFTRKVHEGTRPSIPITPGPSPLGHAAHTRGNGAPECTRHPSCGRGVHEGTTPLAAPYARAHPSPFARKGVHQVHAAPYAQDRHAAPASAPAFPLVCATPFARKGGMRGQAAPSRGAPAGALSVRSRSPRLHPVFARLNVLESAVRE